MSTATFVSCEKENNDDTNDSKNPTVALVKPTSASVTVAPNETVPVEVLAAKGDKNLTSFKVQFSQNGGPYADYSNAFAGAKSDTTFSVDNYKYVRTLPTLTGTGTIAYKFVTTDKDGRTGEKILTINVASAEISTYTATILGAVNNAAGSFMSTQNGNVYTISTAKANSALIDLIYYYTATDKATLAAPDDATAASIYNNANGPANWSTRNATRYSAAPLSNEASFNSITDGTAITLAQAVAPTATSAKSLVAGNVLNFVTGAGKKGQIYVQAVEAGESGKITVRVKVQK